MSEISKNKRWTSFTLDELFDFASGRAIEASESGEYPVFGANGEIGRTDHPTIENVIILGRVGAYCGSVQLSEQKSAATDNTIICKPKKKESHELLYLYYLLQTCNLNKFAGGSAQPLLTQNFLKPIEVIVPSDDLKENIVKVLTSFDDLIENNQRRIEILEESAKALYREWFVHYRYPGHENDTIVDSELGPIPSGWEIKGISELAKVRYGDHLPRKEIAGGPIPVYGAGSKIGLHNRANTSKETIILGCRGTCGEVTITEKHAFVTNNSFLIEPYSSHHFFWLYSLLDYRGVFEFITGTAQPQITIENLNYLRVITPPEALVNDFEQKTNQNFETINCLRKLIDSLSSMRDLLLPRLISGELDVSDLDLVA